MRIVILCILCMFNKFSVVAQSKAARELEAKAYQLNNAFKYDSSLLIIKTYLSQANISSDDKFHAHLYLSLTYKRTFDYKNVLKQLDSAISYGLQTKNPAYYNHKYQFQKSLALFDIQLYHESDSIMKLLEKDNYKYLNDDDVAKVYMQKGYLSLLEKHYADALMDLDSALLITSKVNPCDLPIVYGKRIQLFGATHDIKKLESEYNLGIQKARQCNILKYTLYLNECMFQAHEKMGDYKKAFYYFEKFDSAKTIYNNDEFDFKMSELEKRFDVAKKDKQIAIDSADIKRKKLEVAALTTAMLLLFALALAYLLWQRQIKYKKDRLLHLTFSKEMFEKNEDEKKRIASDLHDSINHELLSLKNSEPHSSTTNLQIDSIINDIRNISRNLHPVLFEALGLKSSLENMFQRLQNQHSLIINSEINYDKALHSKDELQVYRIIQEALSNTIKYSKAPAAKVSINTSADSMLIEIKDSGKGFDVKSVLESSKSFGLHNIIQRSKTLGGIATIESNANGTIIKIKIPIKK